MPEARARASEHEQLSASDAERADRCATVRTGGVHRSSRPASRLVTVLWYEALCGGGGTPPLAWPSAAAPSSMCLYLAGTRILWTTLPLAEIARFCGTRTHRDTLPFRCRCHHHATV
jgi:hypothetical protein